MAGLPSPEVPGEKVALPTNICGVPIVWVDKLEPTASHRCTNCGEWFEEPAGLMSLYCPQCDDYQTWKMENP